MYQQESDTNKGKMTSSNTNKEGWELKQSLKRKREQNMYQQESDNNKGKMTSSNTNKEGWELRISDQSN